MQIALRLESDVFDVVYDIVSFLFYNSWGDVVCFGLEADIDANHRCYTIANHKEDGFDKFIDLSGIMRTVVPGMPETGCRILCTPYIMRGKPRWFRVKGFRVLTNETEDMFALKCIGNELKMKYSYSDGFEDLAKSV